MRTEATNSVDDSSIDRKDIEDRYVVDFFEMSEAAMNELKQSIADHDGLIRIFVHPNYIDRFIFG
ncbi:hypothetical protein HY732_04065 [Candidatus Uhrbacteria bacterium]|nr:hypothetical protein [Candidatus Uhrbacteria bacterium]